MRKPKMIPPSQFRRAANQARKVVKRRENQLENRMYEIQDEIQEVEEEQDRLRDTSYFFDLIKQQKYLRAAEEFFGSMDDDEQTLIENAAPELIASLRERFSVELEDLL